MFSSTWIAYLAFLGSSERSISTSSIVFNLNLDHEHTVKLSSRFTGRIFELAINNGYCTEKCGKHYAKKTTKIMKKMITVAKILTMSQRLDVTERKYFSNSECAASMFNSDSSTFVSIRIMLSSCSKTGVEHDIMGCYLTCLMAQSIKL